MWMEITLAPIQGRHKYFTSVEGCVIREFVNLLSIKLLRDASPQFHTFIHRVTDFIGGLRKLAAHAVKWIGLALLRVVITDSLSEYSIMSD